jgi:hypothetical protein
LKPQVQSRARGSERKEHRWRTSWPVGPPRIDRLSSSIDQEHELGARPALEAHVSGEDSPGFDLELERAFRREVNLLEDQWQVRGAHHAQAQSFRHPGSGTNRPHPSRPSSPTRAARAGGNPSASRKSSRSALGRARSSRLRDPGCPANQLHERSRHGFLVGGAHPERRRAACVRARRASARAARPQLRIRSLAGASSAASGSTSSVTLPRETLSTVTRPRDACLQGEAASAGSR